MGPGSRCNSIAIAWLAAFFLAGYAVWSFQAGELMLIGYLAASVIIYGIVAFLFRCPKCRMPLLLRPRRLLGIEFFTWSLCAPAACRHCGEKIGGQ